MDVDKVEEFIQYFLQNLPIRESVDLSLLMLEERPACLVMDPETEEKARLRNFCRQFNLEFIIREGSRGSMLSKSGFFVTQDKSRLKMLKDSEGRFYGFSDRDVGEFLGFPEDDIEFFHENVQEGHVESRTREIVEEMVSEGKISRKEGRLVELTTYVPRPEEENVLRALERGRHYREALLEFDERNNTSIGRKTLEEFFGDVEI